MGNAGSTPHEDGFRMPARFSRHERTYMAWPTVADYRPDLDRSRREYAAVAAAVSEFEPVTLVVHPDDAAGAAGYLGGAPNIELLELPINDAWIRDSGPIFVSNDNGEVALVNLQFNGWGGRMACDLDMRVGRHLGKRQNMRIYDAPFICEGGGISIDGEGTLITTDRVMQNANRYNGMSRDALERLLLAYLGIEKVIWLERGLVEDESTDGHVDNNVEYIAPGVVLVQTVPTGPIQTTGSAKTTCGD